MLGRVQNIKKIAIPKIYVNDISEFLCWLCVYYKISLNFFTHTGCILAELYTGYPLFPGENEVEQLACIMEILGAPPDDLISQATRRRLFFGKLNLT